MSCGVIHVKNYVLKVSTIGEVGLKLVADSNHCECPKSIRAFYSFQNNVQLLVPESLSHLSLVGPNTAISTRTLDFLYCPT